MDESLFSHLVDSHYVGPIYEGVADPVENPLFSDQ